VTTIAGCVNVAKNFISQNVDSSHHSQMIQTTSSQIRLNDHFPEITGE
jgi:hypothetical protein